MSKESKSPHDLYYDPIINYVKDFMDDRGEVDYEDLKKYVAKKYDVVYPYKLITKAIKRGLLTRSKPRIVVSLAKVKK